MLYKKPASINGQLKYRLKKIPSGIAKERLVIQLKSESQFFLEENIFNREKNSLKISLFEGR